MVIHVDMDAFFAAVEQRDHPEYRGLPVIVGGSKEDRGVVSTASYEARKYGVHSAMAMAEAVRRCPCGIYLPVNMPLYRAVSKQLMAIFHRYTPEVEALSLDEAFLDVTGSQKLFGTAEEIAFHIKEEIRSELSLTASVGIAPNKFLAKIASDLQKPDGFYTIGADEVAQKVWPLSIKRMMGIGEKTVTLLSGLQVHTIGQLAKLDQGLLESLLGKQGVQISQLAKGIDDRPVQPVQTHKSIGREITFPQDIIDPYLLETILFDFTDDVCYTLRSHQISGKTVTIKIRFADLKRITRAMTLSEYTASFEPVFQAVKLLLAKCDLKDTPVRLIGVSMSHLIKSDQLVIQQNIFQDNQQRERYQALNQVMDQLNEKYGGNMVMRARKMENQY